MAQKFLTSIDLGTNELIRPRIHNLTTANQPATGDSVEGQIYFNTSSKFLKVFDGTNWNNIGATYSTSIVDSTGIKLRLAGSDGTTDDVLFTGTNITVSRTDESTIDFALPQSIGTGASPTFAGATLGNVKVGVTDDNEIDTASGNLTIDSAGGTVTIDDNLIVAGNLTVNGTTTTVNSTTVTLDDPIITLGGDTAPSTDDSKDRGVEFRWHNGTAAKVGFFGFEDSSGKFVFKPDATNTSEVFSGDHGTILAGFFEGNGAGVTNLNAGNVSTGLLSAARGGTGIGGYSIGDILYANGGTSFAKLNAVATGNVLLSGGTDTAPSWGKVGLTTHVSGTLPVGSGGTGTTVAPTTGGVAYGSSSSAINYTVAGTSGYLLKSNGTSAPSWVANNMSAMFPTESFKQSVKFATTGNINIASGGTGMSTALTDGVTPVVGDRVLVRAQSTASENGIYLVSGTAWTRALDANAADEIDNAIVPVEQGGSYAGHIFTNKFKSTDTLGTTAMAWYRMMFEDDTITWDTIVENATTAVNVSGTVAIANGGTGATTESGARTNLGVRSYKTSIGDGTQVAFLVTHSFNTRDVMVELYDTATYETVYADVVRTSVNGVTILFNTAPTLNQIRVLIKEIV